MHCVKLIPSSSICLVRIVPHRMEILFAPQLTYDQGLDNIPTCLQAVSFDLLLLRGMQLHHTTQYNIYFTFSYNV